MENYMKNLSKNRERISVDQDELYYMWEVWDVGSDDFLNTEFQLGDNFYTPFDEVNVTDRYDNEASDYIIKRKSDDKLFKFNVEQTNYHGSVFSDYIEEVFPRTITKTIYE